jgi:spermidine/putrescine transport system substrate-binding protein
MKKLLTLLLPVLALGCTATPRAKEAARESTMAPASGGELHILNWAEYFADSTIPNFEKECGCKVIYDNFESGEALRAKLDHVPSGYDVVFPSDEVVPPLVTEGKLEALDQTKLPNLKHISKTFRGMSYDPENRFTVPYMWGLTGIGYDKKKVKPTPDSWGVMLDPKKGNLMTLLDDPRETFTAALRLEGAKDLTSVTPEQIAKAKKRIAAVKPKAWNSQPQSMLIQGDVVLSQMFNGDAAQVAAEGIDFGFVIPKEGGTIWFDNMAIAKGSKQIALAHRFIDYLMRPEVAAANTNFKKYPNPNDAAKPFIEPAILNNPMIYPPESEVARCKVLGDVAPDVRKQIMDAWADIKAE